MRMARTRAPSAPYGRIEFVTLPEAQRITSLGRDSVRRLAADSGSAVKIGKSYRINIAKLLDYIQREYEI